MISNTRYNGQGYDVRLELHGSQGSVAAGLDEGLPLRSADPSITFPAGPAHTFFMDRFATAFRNELATFVEVAAGRQPSPCTVTDGLEASWIAEACTRSRREHRPVRLDEVRRPARPAVREGLRAVLLGHAGHAVEPGAVDALNDTLADLPVELRFTDQGYRLVSAVDRPSLAHPPAVQ